MTLHIYRCAKPQRTRKLCPFHRKLEYGELHRYYDTTLIFFDCGTSVDYGYGHLTPPKLYKRIKIFKDEEGFTVMPCWSSGFLARMVSLKQAHRIAKARLAKGGIIKGMKG